MPPGLVGPPRSGLLLVGLRFGEWENSKKTKKRFPLRQQKDHKTGKIEETPRDDGEVSYDVAAKIQRRGRSRPRLSWIRNRPRAQTDLEAVVGRHRQSHLVPSIDG